MEADCAAHSYGRVTAYFRAHPCAYLVRASFELYDPRKRVVLVAVSYVEMPDAGGAAAYKRLVDRQGTGNVTELTRDVGSYRKYAYSGYGYTSALDGTAVRNTQVLPVGWTPAAAVLRALGESAQ